MSLMISAPKYTKAPRTSLAFDRSAVTYTVVPSHTTSRRVVDADHSMADEASDHMLNYVSGLWAQDWDNPEDSVYDEW